MKSSVIVFPGSNCDRDIAVALEKMQFKNQMIWHKETKLPKSEIAELFIQLGQVEFMALQSFCPLSNVVIVNEDLKFFSN